MIKRLVPDQVSYFGYGKGQEASEPVTISGRDDKRGGVLRQEQPFVDKRRRYGLDLRDIAIAAAIAFFERVAKIVRLYALGAGSGERDQRPVAVGQFLRLSAVDVPAGVGAEWHRDRRQPDSGDLVAVFVDFRNIGFVDRAAAFGR